MELGRVDMALRDASVTDRNSRLITPKYRWCERLRLSTGSGTVYTQFQRPEGQRWTERGGKSPRDTAQNLEQDAVYQLSCSMTHIVPLAYLVLCVCVCALRNSKFHLMHTFAGAKSLSIHSH